MAKGIRGGKCGKGDKERGTRGGGCGEKDKGRGMREGDEGRGLWQKG